MSKAESADLILKLYDLRREEKLRLARDWFATFFPENTADIIEALASPETSVKFRMAISYWDMAASLVNHGAIDEEMFRDTSGEYILFFSKVEPFLDEVREKIGAPKFLGNLETLIMKQPDAKEMLAALRERMKGWAQKRAEMAKN
jgi:hypothetical protein